jgi:hypothetical protein
MKMCREFCGVASMLGVSLFDDIARRRFDHATHKLLSFG